MSDIPSDATTKAVIDTVPGALGGSFSGVFETAGDRDFVRVHVEAGKSYLFAGSVEDGGADAARLTVFEGARSVSVASGSTGVGVNPAMVFTAKTTGDVFVEVSDEAGLAGEYAFFVREVASATVPTILDFSGKVGQNYTGVAGDEMIIGGFGRDFIAAGQGRDVFGEQGDDFLDGNAFANRISGGLGNDQIFAGLGNDFAWGDAGEDLLEGNGGNDVLFGGNGNDRLNGDSGNDRLLGGDGSDEMNGGDGIDTADYSRSVRGAGVDVDLGLGRAVSGEAFGDTFVSVENLTGTLNGDLLSGDAAANVLTGLTGDDRLRGRGGADTLNGGEGVDLASYSDSALGVTVNLATGKGSGGDAQGDVLISIANLDGSARADTLTGSAGANQLQGLAGNDALSGGAGNDLLVGGTGKDVLVGGTGADTFDFNVVFESAVGALRDRIEDFSRAQDDTIDLAGVDAIAGTSGNQAFAFIGSALFTGVAGQLRFNSGGVVQGDTNGDGAADFQIQVTPGLVLTAGDFVL